MRKSRSINLVSQYLENISREVFEKYQDTIRKYVRGRHGVYALYRKNKLYYVGLTSNLRSRLLRHHLRDRHTEAWDSFSVYLTVGGEHLHELEALVLRIVKPKGNRQVSKFSKADDLRKIFRHDIAKTNALSIEQLFCSDSPKKKALATKGIRAKKTKEKQSTLAPFVSRRFHIHFRYKGRLYVAHVRKDGTIKFAACGANTKKLREKVFKSPSLAARAITKHGIDGWYAWKYERAPGDWVFLNELRKK